MQGVKGVGVLLWYVVVGVGVGVAAVASLGAEVLPLLPWSACRCRCVCGVCVCERFALSVFDTLGVCDSENLCSVAWSGVKLIPP